MQVTGDGQYSRINDFFYWNDDLKPVGSRLQNYHVAKSTKTPLGSTAVKSMLEQIK